jgi:two-component system, cell cycle response regulator
MRLRSRAVRHGLSVYYAIALTGLVAFFAHTALGWGGRPSVFFDHWVYNGLTLLAVVGVAARAALVRAERTAWILMAVGLVGWAAGELTYTFAFDGEPPFPSIADAFYLSFYPLAYVALLLLVRGRVSQPNRSVWLDGLAAALAAAAIGAAVLVDIVHETTGGSFAVVATTLAYPLGDVLLLALVVGVLSLTRWRPSRAWIAIGAGLVATAVADGIYLYQYSLGTYVEGHIVDALWPASVLLIAVAAWQPAQRADDVELSGRPLLATPAIAGLVGLSLLVYDHFHPQNALAVWLSAGAVLAVFLRAALTFRENATILARSRELAITDALTGLGNRRKLLVDLDRACSDPDREPRLLALFDLDGFKRYNDTFGHLAGDALLRRLGTNLAAAADGQGSTYRLGGDEFCILAPTTVEKAGSLLEAATNALAEEGEGFSVAASFGVVFIPEEGETPRSALRVADQRLYAQKHAHPGRGRPHEVLLQALFEREPALKLHVQGVTDLSLAVGRRLGLGTQKLEQLRLAAELHDVGKLAIPDTVLRKRGPLDEAEWEFIRQHTVIGQRILDASPALYEVGKLVRWSHERWDGAGYVDGLAGEAIPLAARIISVCDAFAAMTSDRPYCAAVSPADAVEELRRCAGSQFDPSIVEVFCAELAERAAARAA